MVVLRWRRLERRKGVLRACGRRWLRGESRRRRRLLLLLLLLRMLRLMQQLPEDTLDVIPARPFVHFSLGELVADSRLDDAGGRLVAGVGHGRGG